ncbi:MAG TPA: toprim domain-containing protein [Allosphingosinicella sp.]|nr:toprim domain-containing protein [Allosphingosinicella sp.]
MHRPTNADNSTSLEVEGQEIVERLGGEWSPKGGMCRCPAHDDRTPSLSVRPGARRLLFHCFAGCETIRVIAALGALGMLRAGRKAHHGVGPAPVEADRRNAGAAARLWAAARPIEGSPAESYLRGRRLMLAVSDLRYHPRVPYGRGALAIFRPAMLAAVRDNAGLVAVHRTFLDPRTAGLADLALPKRALGRLGQGAVRLFPPGDGMLGWAEGVENAMAAASLFDIPCWATLGTERFARAALPTGITRLILFLDNDAGGRRAETLAREAHRGSAVEIEARYPRAAGADWNDVLLERTR